MIVLGVDPGSLKTGYGVVQHHNGSFSVLAAGVIRLQAAWSHPERIGIICRELEQVIAEFQPERVALETAFLSHNVQAALKLGQVRGAVIGLVVRYALPIYEYAPREVKSAITGKGAATKEQVAFMVSRMLSLHTVPKPHDVTDALGIALCDILRGESRQSGVPPRTNSRRKSGTGGSWEQFVRQSPNVVVRS
jgi:crossover junction endodeoxyribonuclease RuvC|uniref:Crossover junction endodeoxyribonuclease RuvC n=1 Tax=Chlorobium chlorochromatii (strain CaD3) TaxID=340177 RepID=RUVC_CHLCH|nr:RecName: Full=Crossover junction endodeoxyribonuclease RuvC; AltName: Full=Holliday junction nuclease RuvC; AltName: Full=Holliday junction resolvase RuvC [Chlorobium chlorochromatii CaD3]